MYTQDHNKTITTPALAQLISNMLYNKRFFPYYISNIIGGLDEEGKGVLYSYDPVGHCERNMYRAGGSSAALVQPLLDNQIGLKNQTGVQPRDLSVDSAIKIIKDVFISAAERDIYVGDSIDIRIISKDGIRKETFNLRRDWSLMIEGPILGFGRARPTIYWIYILKLTFVSITLFIIIINWSIQLFFKFDRS